MVQACSNMFMFKHVQTEWWQVMMPTCQRPALSLEQSGVERMAQTDQWDCQVSHMPCKCVVCSRMKKDEVSKLCHYFCKVGGLGYFVWKLPYQPGFMRFHDVSWCFTLEQSPSLANRFCHVGIRWVDAVSTEVVGPWPLNSLQRCKTRLWNAADSSASPETKYEKIHPLMIRQDN